MRQTKAAGHTATSLIPNGRFQVGNGQIFELAITRAKMRGATRCTIIPVSCYLTLINCNCVGIRTLLSAPCIFLRQSSRGRQGVLREERVPANARLRQGQDQVIRSFRCG
jgi:hypothetical protein